MSYAHMLSLMVCDRVMLVGGLAWPIALGEGIKMDLEGVNKYI